MEAKKGYFNIVQFCPDRGRAEAANVGVVLFVPSTSTLDVKLDGRVDRVHQCFGRKAIGARWLQTVRELFESGLRRRHLERPFRGPEDLDQYFETLGNQIVVTPSRSTRVENPTADLRRLFAEMVRPHKQESGRSEIDELSVPEIARPLDEAIKHLQARAFEVRFNDRYELPDLDQYAKVDYSIQNGELHLIRLLRLSRANQARNTINLALTLAAKGRLIKEHSAKQESTTKANLVVVATPTRSIDEGTVRDFDAALSNLKAGFNETTWIGSTEIADYAKKLASMEH